MAKLTFSQKPWKPKPIWSVASDGLTKYLPKIAQTSLLEKQVSKLKMKLKIKDNEAQNL